MSRLNARRTSLGALLGLISMGAVAEGQGLDALPANARVRLDFPAADRSRFERSRFGGPHAQSVVGMLAGVRGDTLLLVVRSSAEPLRVPRSAVRSVYLSTGRPPRWRAALDGALAPALVTAALSAAGTSIHRREGDPSPAEAALSGAFWVGGSSAFLSAWHPKERWRPIIPAPPKAR